MVRDRQRGACRQQQQSIRVIPQGFGKLVVLGLVRLWSDIPSRSGVCFVENDQVPFAVFEQHALVFLALQAVERGDGAWLQVPDSRIDGRESPVQRFQSGFLELVLEIPPATGG